MTHEEKVKRITKIAEKIEEKKYNYYIESDERFAYDSIIRDVIGMISDGAGNRNKISLRIPKPFVEKEFLKDSRLRKNILKHISDSPDGDSVRIKFEDLNSFSIDPMSDKDVVNFVNNLNEEEVETYAKIFWDFLGLDIEATNNLKMDFSEREFSEIQDASEDAYLDEKILKETASDIIQEYVSEQLVSNYVEMVAKFFENIANELDHEYGKHLLAVLEKATKKEIANSAIQYYSADEESLNGVIGEIFKSLSKGINKLLPAEVMITIPKEVIAGWGMKKGTFYENAPWNLLKLSPIHLFNEGSVMRHCVGTASGYAADIMEKKREIWSLRNNTGKPKFTFEIDTNWYNLDSKMKSKAILQIKGKGNRRPGFENKNSTEITLPDEVIFLVNLFGDMEVDLSRVDDMKEQIQIMNESVEKI